MSGVAATALFTAVMVPVAEQIGFSPAAITIMVPASAMGIVVEIIMIAVAGTYCLIFAPFL